MRVLSVNHGPLVRSELFGEVILEAGHELVEWEIRDQGRGRRAGSTRCSCSAGT